MGSEKTEEIANLPFEAARDQLREIIQTLEAGSAPLEETLNLWTRGEALAARCRSILDQAMKQTGTEVSAAPDDAA